MRASITRHRHLDALVDLAQPGSASSCGHSTWCTCSVISLSSPLYSVARHVDLRERDLAGALAAQVLVAQALAAQVAFGQAFQAVRAVRLQHIALQHRVVPVARAP
jgi:hypothetical protein